MEVVDIAEHQEEKNKSLLAKAQTLTSQLSQMKTKLLAAGKEVEEKNTDTLLRLKKRKTDIVKKFNRMIEEVTYHTNCSSSQAQGKLYGIDRDLAMLETIKESVNNTKTEQTVVTEKLERISNTTKCLEDELSEREHTRFNCYEYVQCKVPVKDIIGHFVQSEGPMQS